MEVREATGRRERTTLKGDGDRDGRNREGPWGRPSERFDEAGCGIIDDRSRPSEIFDEAECEMIDDCPPGDVDRGREWSEVGRVDGRLGASRWSGSEFWSVSKLPTECRGESIGPTT